MRVPSHYSRADISENMMTPMIDVVFNLLIFFVCASALNIQELVLKADLAPDGTTATSGAPSPTVDPLEAPVDVVSIRLSRRDDGRTIMRLSCRRSRRKAPSYCISNPMSKVVR
ncbi:MAG: biopolymer transporter ExbD [Planctomycetota bacterium]|nr:biopolymer transporter ExbD [Planctomycetota bacterium]